MNLYKVALVNLLGAALYFGCHPKLGTSVNETQTMIDNASETVATMVKTPGIDLSLMDTSADPGDDFYRFVNGKWLDQTEIPEDRTRWGSFDELRIKSSEDVLAVLNEAIASNTYPKGTDQFKAAAFYKSAMDTESINAAGLTPIQPMLDQIANIKTLKDALQYSQRNAMYNSASFFGFAGFADLMNSSMNAPYVTPIGLGLPDRDYYVAEDDKSVETRAAYVKHIARMFGFLGVGDVNAMDKANRVLALETALATPMLTKEERRNMTLLYNPMSFSDLDKLTPGVGFKDYIGAIGASGFDTVIVMQPKFMEAIGAIMVNTDIETIKDFYTWTEFNGAAAYLSSDIEAANFDFYGRQLNGQEVQQPRWERALNVSSGVIGEAIGKLYVDKHFPPEAKAKAQDMIDNIKVAFANRIQNLDWMTADTKVKALDKLNSFTVKIGYPDKWKDYSTLDIKAVEDGGTYASNLLATTKWEFEKMIAEIGKPVDKTEWGMSPQTVNAYYNPLNNEIVFPAAILQPPFYDYQADEAVNYGGIGAVIGHEMSHGFDDQGSRFDADGNMVNWWTEEDSKAFAERNQKLIEQFNAFEVLPGVFVNGEFTLGENIGDLGGINVSYDGLQMFLAKNGRPAPIDGYTSEQRFFMSWATIWRNKIRDEALINRIKTDPHSPGDCRAVGPLVNLEGFYQAFEIGPDNKMYVAPEERVAIW
jgi:putative endopeptidase